VKKGIETWSEYWHLGGEATTHVLCIKKKRGKLSVDEIKEACMAWEWSYWLLLIDGRGEEEPSYSFETEEGDFAACIQMDDVNFK